MWKTKDRDLGKDVQVSGQGSWVDREELVWAQWMGVLAQFSSVTQ